LVDRTAEVRQALLAAGAVLAGPETYEILRVEAGTPRIGIDMDENRFVVEVGRAHAICHTKGCYLGQEPIVMARDRAGHVNRSLRGLKLTDHPAEPKSNLFSDAGQEIGVITSSLQSPRFGPIALAYVRRGFESPETKLKVGAADGQSANVAELPFVN
jgi:folate-binding protein YgfZ